MSKFRLALALFTTALLGACVNSRTHVHQEPTARLASLSVSSGTAGLLDNAREPAAARSDRLFDYPRTPVAALYDVLEASDSDLYSVRRLSFRSAGENGQPGNLVTARYFQSKSAGPKKFLVVLPIWGSYTYPSETAAAEVLRHGRGDTNVLMVLGEADILDWDAMTAAADEVSFNASLQAMAERIRTTVIDLRRLIDWAEAQPEIERGRIGLTGFSFGALMASLVMTVESRVRAGALVMGGAQPHEIFATCGWEPGRMRDTITRRFGWSEERYRAQLESAFAPFDVARRSVKTDPRRVIIFDSFFDSCIPRTARDSLWEAMGRPERISFLYDHKLAFLAMTPLGANYTTRKLAAFLEQALGADR